ncbi:PadR family transcriptional regulator [Streptomyces sp. ATMOS53]
MADTGPLRDTDDPGTVEPVRAELRAGRGQDGAPRAHGIPLASGVVGGSPALPPAGRCRRFPWCRLLRCHRDDPTGGVVGQANDPGTPTHSGRVRLNRSRRQFDVSVGYLWHAPHTQIYGELRKLETAGLVEGEEVPRGEHAKKRRYSLTEAGHDQLRAWMNEVGEPRRERDPQRLRAAYFEWADPEAARAQLEVHARFHEEALASACRAPITHSLDDLRGDIARSVRALSAADGVSAQE